MLKKSILYSVLMGILIVSGCSKTTIVEPANNNSGSGKMLMKVTRDNIPSGVVAITATLNRSGFDSLTSTLNVLTDTASQISFPTVAAGTWNVKVDAKNANNAILYTGTATVDVAVGYTTQLSITLNPVMTTGGVQISVTWGTVIQTAWRDYPSNPVIEAGNYSYESGGVIQPTVLYENGTYKMWFSSLGSGGVCVVGYSTSTDGLTWTRYPSPVLTPTPGTWDAGSTNSGPVIKVDNTYRMYYSGWSTEMGSWSIGLATSSDGITWTKYAQPVLAGTSTGTEYRVGVNDIVKFNNKYFLYYSLPMSSIYNSYVAISDDGLSWTRYSGNPVLTATEAWEGSSVLPGSVTQDGSLLKMAYANASLSAIGFATSTDGLHWTKDSSNPIFSNSGTANKWTNTLHYPCLRKLGNEWRIYYCGFVGSVKQIGVLRKI